MNRALKSFFAAAFLLVLTLPLWGQAKVYTKRVLLEDFPTKTTKVVLAGQSFLEMSLREEIAARWRISPYEFCTAEDYEKQKTNNSFYFLRLVSADGIAFLELTKGGKPDEQDNLKKAVDVCRIPISASDVMSGEEIVFIGAFIDIIQKFTEESIISDRVGYTGLSSYNRRSLKDMTAWLDGERTVELYQTGINGDLIGVCIAPTEIGLRSKCYKMLVSATTNELFYYSEQRYRGPADRAFTEKEAKSFEHRNAVVHR